MLNGSCFLKIEHQWLFLEITLARSSEMVQFLHVFTTTIVDRIPWEENSTLITDNPTTLQHSVASYFCNIGAFVPHDSLHLYQKNNLTNWGRSSEPLGIDAGGPGDRGQLRRHGATIQGYRQERCDPRSRWRAAAVGRGILVFLKVFMVQCHCFLMGIFAIGVFHFKNGKGRLYCDLDFCFCFGIILIYIWKIWYQRYFATKCQSSRLLGITSELREKQPPWAIEEVRLCI